jgi:hypothetical protein
MPHRSRQEMLMLPSIVLVIAVLISAPSIAAASQASQPPADSPLAPLGFLIGKWEETRQSPLATDGRVNHLEMAWDLEGRYRRRADRPAKHGGVVSGWNDGPVADDSYGVRSGRVHDQNRKAGRG